MVLSILSSLVNSSKTSQVYATNEAIQIIWGAIQANLANLVFPLQPILSCKVSVANAVPWCRWAPGYRYICLHLNISHMSIYYQDISLSSQKNKQAACAFVRQAGTGNECCLAYTQFHSTCAADSSWSLPRGICGCNTWGREKFCNALVCTAAIAMAVARYWGNTCVVPRFSIAFNLLPVNDGRLGSSWMFMATAVHYSTRFWNGWLNLSQTVKQMTKEATT